MSQMHPETIEALKSPLVAKPQKAFAAAFIVLATALAGCASGLGGSVPESASVGTVSRFEEGRVVAARAEGNEGAKYGAYMIRLRTGELVSVAHAGTHAIPEGTPVVIQYGVNTRIIPQNASIGYY